MTEFLAHLAPTADISPTATKEDRPRRDGPCPFCGAYVLTGRTRDGTRVVVDLTPQTLYSVVWHKEDEPVMSRSESRGYVVHHCTSKETTG